jgi:hypothetical protein
MGNNKEVVLEFARPANVPLSDCIWSKFSSKLPCMKGFRGRAIEGAEPVYYWLKIKNYLHFLIFLLAVN